MAHDPHAAHATADDEYVNPPSGSGHEHTDASVWLIVKYTIWLAVTAVAVHIGMWFAFYVFVDQRMNAGTPEFPLAIEQGPRLPAGPRLQAQPVNEIYEFRLRERAILDSYGWVDREGGVVRIPIAEAMRLTVEGGLPAREAGDGEALETPGLMPTDGSAGRLMERRRQ